MSNEAIAAVARSFGISELALVGRNRSQPVAEARFSLFALMREMGMKDKQIANATNRHRTSVVVGVARWRQIVTIDPIYLGMHNAARNLEIEKL